jgi:hypothetical protein
MPPLATSSAQKLNQSKPREGGYGIPEAVLKNRAIAPIPSLNHL